MTSPDLKRYWHRFGIPTLATILFGVLLLASRTPVTDQANTQLNEIPPSTLFLPSQTTKATDIVTTSRPETPSAPITATLNVTPTQTQLPISKPTLFAQSTSTPTKEPGKDVQNTTFYKLMEPFIRQAKLDAAKRALEEPDFNNKINLGLNAHRINFLLDVEAITYEPPYVPDHAGSYNIVSYDYANGVLDDLTINHDARAPEIERYYQSKDPTQQLKAHKFDQLRKAGGASLSRLGVENATGLRIDFQVKINDIYLAKTLTALGGVKIKSPLSFKTHPCYVRPGVPYVLDIKAGIERTYSGEEGLCFVKGTPDYNGRPMLKDEQNKHRIGILKNAAVDALKQQLLTNSGRTVSTLTSILIESLLNKDVEPSFDLGSLGLPVVQRLGDPSLYTNFAMPTQGSSLYLAPTDAGDGCLNWVATDGSAQTKRDLATGVYKRNGKDNMTLSVATGGNPYGPSLPDDYWHDCRKLVNLRFSRN